MIGYVALPGPGRMRGLLVCLAAIVMVPAMAQSNLLPEGSSDIEVGAVIGTAPSAPGSASRSAFLLPQFSAQWDNGVFVDGLALGVQLSGRPLLKYGALVALDMGTQHSDGRRSGVRPVLGAFVDYEPLRELSLHAQLTAPAGEDGSGVLVNARASTGGSVGAHASVTTGIGFNLADARYMQATFGTGDYRPARGVRDLHADVRWYWQMSRKLTLTASLQVSRLQGDAAASPRTQRRTGVTNWLALGYSY
jgi:outer membrane protein